MISVQDNVCCILSLDFNCYLFFTVKHLGVTPKADRVNRLKEMADKLKKVCLYIFLMNTPLTTLARR